jgi:hypothetical protein
MMLTTLAIVVTYFLALTYIKNKKTKRENTKKIEKMVEENKNIYQ